MEDLASPKEKVKLASTTFSLKEAILFLRQFGERGIHNQVKMFEIDPRIYPIQIDDLKQLVSFPFEFSMHEEKGKLRVATGDERNPTKMDTLRVPENTLLYAHTHSNKSRNTFVSFADILVTDNFESETQQLLITKEGIVVYKRPQFDPIRKMPTDESPRELLYEWSERRNIDFFSKNPQQGKKSFFDLSDQEKMQLAKDFTKDTEMIVKAASWDYQEDISLILSAINQRIVISDNRTPKIPSVLDDLGINLNDFDIEANPAVATIQAVAEHIDSVRYKKGTLLGDRNARKRNKKFALELIDREILENPPKPIKEILLKFKEATQQLSID